MVAAARPARGGGTLPSALRRGICLLELAHGSLDVEAPFEQGFGVPLAAFLARKSPPYTWIAPVSRAIGLVTEWMMSAPSGVAFAAA